MLYTLKPPTPDLRDELDLGTKSALVKVADKAIARISKNWESVYDIFDLGSRSR
jgi:hypothetical protein